MMTGRELLRIVTRLGCEIVRQRGSHVRVRCSWCRTSVPVHAGEDLKVGLMSKIERDLAPCLGPGWLRKARERR